MTKYEPTFEKQITIHDVAKLANVSVSTVSRVFHGKDRVSEETRKKVQQAMETLNYVPSTIATSMITGKTMMILVLVPDFNNPFYTSILGGIESTLHANGYYSMVFSYNKFSRETYAQIQSRFDKIVDGIIALPDHKLQFQWDWNKPSVILDRKLSDFNSACVLADNYRGARLLTQELVNAGHRKIAIICGEPWQSSIADRMAGYRSVMEDFDIPVQERYLVLEPNLSVSSGYDGFHRLMKLDDPPTAVFAANNLTCIGCIQACQELGLQIGEDISLVGFDDHELAQYISNGITVIRQPAYEMGEQAATSILAQLDQNAPSPVTHIMDVELIRRGSIKNLNNA